MKNHKRALALLGEDMKYYLFLAILDLFLCFFYITNVFVSELNKPVWLLLGIVWGACAYLNYKTFNRKQREYKERYIKAFEEMNEQ